MHLRTPIAVRRLQDPRYTGANRCVPCTAVNLAAVVVAAGLAVVLVAPWLGFVVSAGGLLLLYFAGYVVPGTPTLTKRYLPDRVLAWFGKDPDRTAVDGANLERRLIDSGVLVPCPTGDDLCLDPSFDAAWVIRARDAYATPSGHVEALVADETGAVVDLDHRPSGVAATRAGRTIGLWPSLAAFAVDAAANRELAALVPGWEAGAFDERAGVLAGLRLWVTTCPACDGDVTLAEETVETCCTTRDVVAATCCGCGVRLLEAAT